jgi:hypothetical protein
MKTIETTILVPPGGKLTLELDLPPNIPPGEHHIVVVIDDDPLPLLLPAPLEFPVIDVGPWPEHLSLRREDLYDDWGR